MVLTQSSGLQDPSTNTGQGSRTLAIPAVSILCGLRTPSANQADSQRQTQLCLQTLKGRHRLLRMARQNRPSLLSPIYKLHSIWAAYYQPGPLLISWVSVLLGEIPSVPQGSPPISSPLQLSPQLLAIQLLTSGDSEQCQKQ